MRKKSYEVAKEEAAEGMLSEEVYKQVLEALVGSKEFVSSYVARWDERNGYMTYVNEICYLHLKTGIMVVPSSGQVPNGGGHINISTSPTSYLILRTKSDVQKFWSVMLPDVELELNPEETELQKQMRRSKKF